MVQQLIKEGNLRDLILRASPAGLMHRMICRLERMFEMKKDQRYRLVISVNNVWLYKGAEKEDRGGEKSCFRRGDTP